MLSERTDDEEDVLELVEGLDGLRVQTPER